MTYEACAAGLPVLTTPMGQGRIISDNVTGAVCAPGDVEAWSEKLAELANDPELRERLGRAARQSAENFTWAKVGEARGQQIVEAVRARKIG